MGLISPRKFSKGLTKSIINIRYPFFLCLLIGCASKSLTENELKQYPLNPEHGLIQRIEKGDIVLEMYYKPKDLLLSQELHGVNNLLARNEAKRRLDSMDYFVLRLSSDHHEIETGYSRDPAKFNEVINYLSFDMGKDIRLICGHDSLPPIGVVYVRSFGSASTTSVMVAFKSYLDKRSNATAVCDFDDSEFGTGLNKFEFEINRIRQIPTLTSN